MALSSSGPRERILVIGSWGAGKSTCAVDLARRGASITVIDTTYEAERNFHGIDGVKVVTVETWPEYTKAVQNAKLLGNPDHWLVIDRADPAWDEVQAEYSRKAHGEEIDEWFIAYAKSGGKGNPFSGGFGTEWSVIRRMYSSFITPILTYPGNVLCIAKSKPVTEQDNENIRNNYAKFGVKPAGEGNLGFQFHTVLHLAEVKDGWVYTTIRDRGREQQKMKRMDGFVVSYLVGVAGWKL